MKKVLLSAVVLAAAFSTASAQGISIGPRLGVNISNIKAAGGDSEFRDAYNDETKSLIGFQAGVALNLGITESFSVQPELLFSQQGAKAEFDGFTMEDPTTGIPISVDGDIDATYRTNYLQLPVLARYSFGSGDVKFFVNAGPYASYWLGGKQKVEGTATINMMGFQQSFPIDEEQDIKFEEDEDGNGYNRLDVGLVAGAGVSLPAGPGSLVVDVRYNYGLSDMNKYGSDRPDDMYKESHRFIGVGVSYMFGMGE